MKGRFHSVCAVIIRVHTFGTGVLVTFHKLSVCTCARPQVWSDRHTSPCAQYVHARLFVVHRWSCALDNLLTDTQLSVTTVFLWPSTPYWRHVCQCHHSPVSSARDPKRGLVQMILVSDDTDILGVYLDADPTMTAHVNATVRACFRSTMAVTECATFTVKERFADATSCSRRQQSRLLQYSAGWDLWITPWWTPVSAEDYCLVGIIGESVRTRDSTSPWPSLVERIKSRLWDMFWHGTGAPPLSRWDTANDIWHVCTSSSSSVCAAVAVTTCCLMSL